MRNTALMVALTATVSLLAADCAEAARGGGCPSCGGGAVFARGGYVGGYSGGYSSMPAYAGGSPAMPVPAYAGGFPAVPQVVPQFAGGFSGNLIVQQPTLNPVVPVLGAENTTQEATLIVSLPEDAKLTIDSFETKSTSGQRVFVTPPLKPGTDFSYTLKAQAMRNGEMKTVVQKVTVRAGQQTPVTIEIPGTNVVLK